MKKITCAIFVCVFIILGFACSYAVEQHLLKVNAKGLGQIVVVNEGEEIEFSEEYPMQSSYINADEGMKYSIGAKADENWTFVKWTLFGKDYSEDEIINIELDSDLDLVAVFKMFDEYGREIRANDDFDENIEAIDAAVEDEEITNENKNNILLYIGIAVAAILIISIIVIIIRKKR